MATYYRSKIVAKRQVTLPQAMLEQLGTQIGDELEFAVENDRIAGVKALRATPINPFTPEIRAKLAQRRAEVGKGMYGDEFVPGAEEASGLHERVDYASLVEEAVRAGIAKYKQGMQGGHVVSATKPVEDGDAEQL